VHLARKAGDRNWFENQVRDQISFAPSGARNLFAARPALQAGWRFLQGQKSVRKTGTQGLATQKHLNPKSELSCLVHKTLLKTLSIIATAIVVTSAGIADAQPRRATSSLAPGDILRVANVSDAQISPNGQWVVYTVSTSNGDETVSS